VFLRLAAKFDEFHQQQARQKVAITLLVVPEHVLGVFLGRTGVVEDIVENEIALCTVAQDDIDKLDCNWSYITHRQDLFVLDGVVLSHIYFTMT